MLPFNIELLDVTPFTRQMRPIKVLDTFEGNTTNFHPDGLFSTEIFGRVGDDVRDQRYSYIELNTTILHPIIFRLFMQLKRLYVGILEGTQYARWDPELSDFVAANALEGQTGYAFFISHWREIKFKPTKSPIRQDRIKAIVGHQKGLASAAEVSRVLVIPAGLRDAEIKDDGHRVEDEINTFYRDILRIANTIGFTTGEVKGNQSSIIDNSRYIMQQRFNAIYWQIHNFLFKGKGSFMLSTVISRRIYNGTRGVFTSMDMRAGNLTADNYPRFNQTVLGLHQASRGALPKVIYALRQGWLADVFSGQEGMCTLVDPKTLKPTEVRVQPDTYDRWTTTEGLEKVIAMLDEVSLRNHPIMVEGFYLGLVYISPLGHKPLTYRIFNNIDDLPEGLDRANVYPLNLTLLIYLSGLSVWDTLCMLVTRYPITGLGSIYGSELYLKVTLDSTERYQLDNEWNPTDIKAREFPSISEEARFIDTIIPNPSRLQGMGADFDGDTGSATITYTDEALAEQKRLQQTREFWLLPDGQLKASASYHITNLFFKNMTGK